MTTASEPTNYVYSAFAAANIDPELAHNAADQILNVAGRNITDHVDRRFETVENRINNIDKRIDTLDKNLTERIDTLDKNLTERIDTLNKNLTELDKNLTERIDTLNKNLTERIDTLDRHFNRIVNIQLVLIVSIVGLLGAALFT